jgi:hypothetical protein
MSESQKGRVFSAEHRARISEAAKNRPPMSEETRKKIGKIWIGRKHSEETKKKMSEAQKGVIFSDEHRAKIKEARKRQTFSEETRNKIGEAHKGNTNMLGKHHTIESRKKMSSAHKGKGTGKNNPAWRGGITPESRKVRNSVEYSEWKDIVLVRDDYTDQKTNIKEEGQSLEVHHILNFSSYPELRFEVSNGIVLSKESHKQFHRKYGIKNNTQEQLDEFLAA